MFAADISQMLAAVQWEASTGSGEPREQGDCSSSVLLGVQAWIVVPSDQRLHHWELCLPHPYYSLPRGGRSGSAMLLVCSASLFSLSRMWRDWPFWYICEKHIGLAHLGSPLFSFRSESVSWAPPPPELCPHWKFHFIQCFLGLIVGAPEATRPEGASPSISSQEECDILVPSSHTFGGDAFSQSLCSLGGEDGCYLVFFLHKPKQLPQGDWDLQETGLNPWSSQICSDPPCCQLRVVLAQWALAGVPGILDVLHF